VLSNQALLLEMGMEINPKLEPNTFTVVYYHDGDSSSSGPMTLELAQKQAARDDSYWMQSRQPTGKGEVWSAHLDAKRHLTLVAKIST
jgi:hypothetical protein